MANSFNFEQQAGTLDRLLDQAQGSAALGSIDLFDFVNVDEAIYTPVNIPFGDVAKFYSSGKFPLYSLRVKLEPQQSGSGTPSPDNVRPITGFDGLTIYHSGEDTSEPAEITVSWQDEAGIIYAGSIDLITGKLISTFGLIDLGSINWQVPVSGNYMYSTGIRTVVKKPADNYSVVNAISDRLVIKSAVDVDVPSGNGFAIVTNGNIRVRYDGYSNNPNTFKSDVAGWIICFELENPVEYQLDPVIITALVGENNIWSDSGQVSVTYRDIMPYYIEDPLSIGVATLK